MRFDERLADLRYHHVLIEDPGLASRNIGQVVQSAGRWTSEVGLTASSYHALDAGPAADAADPFGPNQASPGSPPTQTPNAAAWCVPPPAPQPDLGVGL